MAIKQKQSTETIPNGEEIKWPFGMKNYILFGIAMIVIIIGFVLLGNNSIVAAPVLLVLGYCVLLPIAIIIRDKKVFDSESSESQSE